MGHSRIGRLIVLFTIAFSLAALSGVLAKDQGLQIVPSVHAASQPCIVVGAAGECSEPWYPGGPAMGTEQVAVYSSASQEYSNLLSSQPTLDFTDSPCPSLMACAQVQNDPNLTLTAPVNGNQYGYCGIPPTGVLGPTGTSSDPSNTCGTWSRVVNGDPLGLPNYFTWLNAWNQNPAQANTIRQAFGATTRSVNPYAASTPEDFQIVGNVYDSLSATNPLNPAQMINWMDYSPATLLPTQLTYTPPPGTVQVYRFTLIAGLNFQDGTPVTSFDAAFSYLSIIGSGAFQSGFASPLFLGVTILGPHQFDIAVASASSALTNMTSITIVPGRYWTNSPTTWNTDLANCTGMNFASCYPVQYILSGSLPSPVCILGGCANFPASNMQWDTNKISPTYDPIASHIFIGSGPWQCGSGSNLGGPNCEIIGIQGGPANGYILTANPSYVRSSNNLALWLWASNGDPTGPSFFNYSFTAFCFNQLGTPVGTNGGPSAYSGNGGSSAAQACSHWQEGIGGPSGIVPAGTLGAPLSIDPRIQYVGGSTFAAGDTIVYNSVGGNTFATGDTVIAGSTPIVGTPLSNDPLLKFYDNPAFGSIGAWVNGKSIVYDTDNSGGYDFGDISTSQTSNGLGASISPNKGISIPPPPPGGCPSATTNGCWLNEGSTQVAMVALRVGLNLVSPFNWASSQPTGIGSLPPVIYQPNTTVPLNPGSTAACTVPFNPTSPTSGGYDC